MNPKQTNPYMDIELSPDSEPEEQLWPAEQPAEREGRGRKPHKRPVAKPSKGKKSDVVIKFAKTIRNKLAIGDVNGVVAEFEGLLSEIAKMKKLIEIEGPPFAFLQTIDFLNENFILGKTSIDAKKKKELSKQINALKKKISGAFSEFEQEIAEAKKSPDFFKQDAFEGEGSEAEPEGATGLEGSEKASDVKSHVFEPECSSEEEAEELDFSKRLTLVGEERRKFWLYKPKEKKEASKKPQKTTHRPKKEVVRATVRRITEEDEFKNIDLNQSSLEKRLKDLYDRKMMFKEEEFQLQLRLLSFIYKNVESTKERAEVLLLLLNFQLEHLRSLGLSSLDDWKECFENCKALFEIVKGPHIKLVNYIKGIDVELERQDLLRYFNGFLNQMDNEVFYSLKLSQPFDEDFSSRIEQEIDWVGFLMKISEFYKSQPESEANKRYLNEIAFKIAEHIYHNADDFLLNSQKLSLLFEEESISAAVERLAAFVYNNNTEAHAVAKMQLYHAYNLAINLDRLDLASSLLHKALDSGVISQDRNLVGLFNRALAVIGTAEFKLGNFDKCKYYLFELVNSENIEALLFQYDPASVNILDFSNPLFMFPYHLHVNIEEVEAAFLLASVLTEAHKSANFQDNLGRSEINKKMLRFIERYQKNLFINSMQNIFDQIFVCYRKIVQYDFKAAFEAVRKLKYLSNQDNYEESILPRIKAESFNCYIEKLKNETHAVVKISDLAGMFDIQPTDFLALLKNKMENGDLNGHLDEADDLLLVENKLSEVLQKETDFELLESLKGFYELNNMLNKSGKEKQGGKWSGSELNEVSHFIHKRFDLQDKHFNFAFDLAFFKKVLG